MSERRRAPAKADGSAARPGRGPASGVARLKLALVDAFARQGLCNPQWTADSRLMPPDDPRARAAPRDRARLRALLAGSFPQGRFEPEAGPLAATDAAVRAAAADLAWLADITALGVEAGELARLWLAPLLRGRPPAAETSRFGGGWGAALARLLRGRAASGGDAAPADRPGLVGRRLFHLACHGLRHAGAWPEADQARLAERMAEDCRALLAHAAGQDDGSDLVMWRAATGVLAVQRALPGLISEAEVRLCVGRLDAIARPGRLATGARGALAAVSAAADLMALDGVPGLEPPAQRVRRLGASLIRADGGLCAFGTTDSSGHAGLCRAVWGPSAAERPDPLLSRNLAHVTAPGARLWVAAVGHPRACGPAFEFESEGVIVIASWPELPSALELTAVPGVDPSGRLRRRNDERATRIEAETRWGGTNDGVAVSRLLTLSADGAAVSGQDMLMLPPGRTGAGKSARLRFVLGPGCHAIAARDARSVLLVAETRQAGRQAWRFRAEGLDIALERPPTQANAARWGTDPGLSGRMLVAVPAAGAAHAGHNADRPGHWAWTLVRELA